MNVRDRIKGLRRVKASRLRPHPKNWRTHPVAQQDAVGSEPVSGPDPLTPATPAQRLRTRIAEQSRHLARRRDRLTVGSPAEFDGLLSTIAREVNGRQRQDDPREALFAKLG